MASSLLSPAVACGGTSSVSTTVMTSLTASRAAHVVCAFPAANVASAACCAPSSAPQTHSRGSASPHLGAGSSSRAAHVAHGIRAVESFETDFDLDQQAREILVYLLSSDVFQQQVATQPGVPVGTTATEFTGELFQPVPWSPVTRFGMPQELERFNEDKDNYIIINVPPNFMFKAQVFKPSRLCAIYRAIKEEGGEQAEGERAVAAKAEASEDVEEAVMTAAQPTKAAAAAAVEAAKASEPASEPASVPEPFLPSVGDGHEGIIV